ncbi:conserved hypothetical protein [Bradyrhizobium sp. STM 3843]|nr:conserved hypothetical protein [Bradyrhizobium sp. STM 3843]
MAEIIDRTIACGDARADARAVRLTSGPAHSLVQLDAIPLGDWGALCDRALEPNGYYLPDWEAAVNASARGRTGTSALCVWNDGPPARLIGLMPVTSLWRAYKVPLPALVSGHPYGTLCTPLVDRDLAEPAVAQLLRAARQAGARALLLRDVALEGAVMQAITSTLAREGLEPRVLQSYSRACLEATGDGDDMLRDALGPKKLKELRRQRHRLAEHGPVSFDIARTPRQVALALEAFLELEASGWKGRRGTALIQHEGDAAFIRRAAPALAANNQCEVVTLRSGDTAVASGVVLRHQSRAFFFKLGVDERYAKYSPGVQLTIALTRHLCADPAIASADSTAAPDHPMINPIWRGRLAIGDVLLPLRARDPLVELIHATLAARRNALDVARRGVHIPRGLRTR